MAYSKQTWATGDTITAAKLNHMESGIETATALTVTFNAYQDDDLNKDIISCDRTFSECLSAWENGNVLIGVLNLQYGVHEFEATGIINYVEDDEFYMRVDINKLFVDAGDETKLGNLIVYSAQIYYGDVDGLSATLSIGNVNFTNNPITTSLVYAEYSSETEEAN